MSPVEASHARTTTTGGKAGQSDRTAPQKRRQPGPAQADPSNLKHVNVPRVLLKWPSEVAAACGVSDEFVRKQGWAASLPMVQVGSLRLVLVSTLVAFLSERESLPLDGRADR